MELVLGIADAMIAKTTVPCTGCHYCVSHCPQKLDIPMLLSLYNDMRFSPSLNVGMVIDSLKEESRPSSCIRCGRCAKICPQKIDIPAGMKAFSEMLAYMPHWEEMCRQREEAANRLREQESI